MTFARIVADSISPDGVRLTTMEVEMHRFVLAEFNTHRVFSRNSASSRAIPIERQIKNIRERIAYPVVWPEERPGMQGGDEIDDPDTAAMIWAKAADDMINHVLRLRELNLHKSVSNRLLEPFMLHRVLVSSTEWENFFALRCHEMAQPEIRVAAECMQNTYHLSTPIHLEYGDWHTPFVDNGFWNERSPESMETALKTSSACAAWVSTSNHDGDHSIDAVHRMYDRLSSADPMHASPFEHQATPWSGDSPGNFTGWMQFRHMIEGGMEPWRTMSIGQVSISGDVTLDDDFDSKEYEVDGFIVGVEEGLLDGIEPLRPEREGREGDTQPLPTEGVGPFIVDLVKADLDARLALGIARYGKGLQAFNGRNPKQDLYEEIMDALCYLKQDIEEDRIRSEAIDEIRRDQTGLPL